MIKNQEIGHNGFSNPLYKKALPFIIISGVIQEEAAIALMRAGAHDYMMKGRTGRLAEALRREIREAGVRAERRQAEIELRASELRFRRRNQELEASVDFSSSMRRAQTRSELISLILQKTMQSLKAQMGVLAFVDGDLLVFEDGLGCSPAWIGQGLARDHSVFWHVLQSGQLLASSPLDRASFSLWPDWMVAGLASIAAVMIAPLKSSTASVGLLFLGFAQPQAFAADQQPLMDTLAEMIGSALYRMIASEKIEAMMLRRTRELESIYQITSAASQSLDLQAVLPRAFELILAAVNATTGGIYLLNEMDNRFQRMSGAVATPLPTPSDSLITLIGHGNQLLRIPDIARDERFTREPVPVQVCSFTGLPMLYKDHVIGVLAVFKLGGQQLDPDEMTLLMFIAEQLAMIVENARLFQKAERSAILEERARLARELHNSVTQSLYSAMLYSSGASEYITQGNYEQVAAYLTQVNQITQQALKEMRLMVYGLRSPDLSLGGLVDAVQNRLDAVERRSKILVQMDETPISPLPPRFEDGLYWIGIEALNNSLKHARASQVWVEISQNAERLLLAVEDDGCGFDAPAALTRGGGMGLTNMRERAETLGGIFNIYSHPGDGTRVEVQIPLSKINAPNLKGEA